MSTGNQAEVCFGPYRLNSAEERLRRGNEVVKLTPKSFALLRYLIDSGGRLVTKEELFNAVWPDVVVSDAALTRCIREIREALADDSRYPRYIETAHRRGFRFIGLTAEAHPAAPQTTTQYANSDGVHIAYQVFGDGPLNLVVAPGWVSNVEGWWEMQATTTFFQRLAAFARVVLFDKRGTGMSDPFPLDHPPTMDQRMDDIRAVMDAAGMPRAALLGYSEGGPMTLLFAATYPERTAALILYGTSAKQEWEHTFGPPLAASPDDLAHKIEERWAQGWPPIEVWAPSVRTSAQDREQFARFMRRGASPAAAAAIIRLSYEIDVRPLLPAIHVPTLILHRRDEEAISVQLARYLADHIPHAKYIEMAGIDHLLWAGDQREIPNAVEKFLSEIHQSPAAGSVATVLLVEVLDPDRVADGAGGRTWSAVPARHHLRVHQQLRRFRGRAAARTLSAVFDGPVRAVECGLKLLELFDQIGIRVRASVHTGEALYQEGEIKGEASATAERILAAAASETLWASAITQNVVVGSGIQFADLGQIVLTERGLELPLFAVARTAARRRSSPAAALTPLRRIAKAGRAAAP